MASSSSSKPLYELRVGFRLRLREPIRYFLNSITLEGSLFAEKLDDPIGIGTPSLQRIILHHARMQKDVTDQVEILGQLAPDLLGKFLGHPILPDKSKALLGSYAHHTLVEVCPY